jgi:hypothetical protein
VAIEEKGSYGEKYSCHGVHDSTIQESVTLWGGRMSFSAYQLAISPSSESTLRSYETTIGPRS